MRQQGGQSYIYMSASQGYFEEQPPSSRPCSFADVKRPFENNIREESVALAQVFSWAKTDRHSNDDTKCFRYKKKHPSGMAWQMPVMDD